MKFIEFIKKKVKKFGQVDFHWGLKCKVIKQLKIEGLVYL